MGMGAATPTQNPAMVSCISKNRPGASDTRPHIHPLLIPLLTAFITYYIDIPFLLQDAGGEGNCGRAQK
jgi:hypothetical protein